MEKKEETRRISLVIVLLFLLMSSHCCVTRIVTSESEEFYPGCTHADNKVTCLSTGIRRSGFYAFAGGSPCCGCTTTHSGTLPENFPSISVDSVTFYLATSRNNSYYTAVQEGPTDITLVLGESEATATSILDT